MRLSPKVILVSYSERRILTKRWKNFVNDLPYLLRTDPTHSAALSPIGETEFLWPERGQTCAESGEDGLVR